MNRYQRVAIVLAAINIAILFTGCGSSPQTSVAPAPGGVVGYGGCIDIHSPIAFQVNTQLVNPSANIWYFQTAQNSQNGTPVGTGSVSGCATGSAMICGNDNATGTAAAVTGLPVTTTQPYSTGYPYTTYPTYTTTSATATMTVTLGSVMITRILSDPASVTQTPPYALSTTACVTGASFGGQSYSPYSGGGMAGRLYLLVKFPSGVSQVFDQVYFH